jgi:hypothetical protein
MITSANWASHDQDRMHDTFIDAITPKSHGLIKHKPAMRQKPPIAVQNFLLT